MGGHQGGYWIGREIWRGRAAGCVAALLAIGSTLSLGVAGVDTAAASPSSHTLTPHVAPPNQVLTWTPLGQPNINSTAYNQRCAGANAQFSRQQFFNGQNQLTFEMDGPSGIAISPSGRISYRVR